MRIGEKFNKSGNVPRVLVAPLNWGLGHATRCIPLIHALTANGCEVVIAAPESIRRLLQEAFPELQILPIIGYTIQYSKSRFMFPFKLLLQLPGLLLTIYREQKWLKKAIVAERLDAVISDNRFGLHSRYIPSVFITHQLAIQAGSRLMNRLSQRINYFFIRRFNECWVPDAAGVPNLAGSLSHPSVPCPTKVKYLGPLSRLEKSAPADKKYDLLILLSGPEPQRSIFETMILQELQGFPGKILLIRGLPMQHNHRISRLPQMDVADYLAAPQLADAISQSATILCRSGYTTIMDLVKLGRSAILVPTPGQTEQEYLARYLEMQGFFTTITQSNFSLAALTRKMTTMAETTPFAGAADDYRIVVQDWVAILADKGNG